MLEETKKIKVIIVIKSNQFRLKIKMIRVFFFIYIFFYIDIFLGYITTKGYNDFDWNSNICFLK